MILPTKHERVRCFIRGLRLHLLMVFENIVSLGRLFIDIAYHDCILKGIHREACGGHDKRPYHLGNYSGSYSGSVLR